MAWQLTATAQSHFENAIIDTREKWGLEQAIKYSQELLDGFDLLANGEVRAKNLHQQKLAKNSKYSLFLHAHRYIVYKNLDEENIIIAAIFHERMDIPKALKRISDNNS